MLERLLLKKSKCMVAVFESGVDHANRREKEFRQKTSFAFFAGRSFSSLICVDSWLILLRRQRGDDLFKTRIAAQRIPGGQQFQLAVGGRCGILNSGTERFARDGFIANPSSDHSQI